MIAVLSSLCSVASNFVSFCKIEQIYVFLFVIRFYVSQLLLFWNYPQSSGRGGHDRMVVGFTTTCAVSAYHH